MLLPLFYDIGTSVRLWIIPTKDAVLKLLQEGRSWMMSYAVLISILEGGQIFDATFR